MASANGDRNLLFGILALQMDFISRDALVKAMNAWVLDKAKALGLILLEQGALTEDTHALLDALVRKHLELHGGDAEKSLASVSSVGSARDELQRIADADVQASLIHLPPAGDSYATDPPSTGAPSAVGRRFRILRPHAKGGLGEVFVARDEELNREVALKEIQERHADHPESRARFLVEAEITGGLEHPGIVPVYGLGTYADGRPFYAMRFIKGDSLKEAVERFHKPEARRRPAEERALELRKLLGRFVDVCEAIGYAHSRGVLHRDLKPGNVMLGKYGETLVVDWGLAKSVGRAEQAESGEEPTLRPASASGSAETLPGRAIGTPAYMSPEQAAGRLEQMGPASDVYGLGATLYTLLTGKPPFSDPDIGAVLRKVERGEFPRPRQVNRSVPPALEAICLKAMALKAGDRYASTSALADDVEHWLADEPVSVYREGWTERVVRWARRRPSAAAFLALFIVALLAGTAVSTYFGVESNANYVDARRREKDANDALGIVKAQKDELGKTNVQLKDQKQQLGKTNDQLEETLARSLLRPLGQDETQVADPEIEALWELTGSNERVHMLFFEQALRGPVTLRQLRNLADMAIHAAVSLDPERRRRVEKGLLTRLRDRDSDFSMRTDCVQIGVALGDLSPDFVSAAVPQAVEAMGKTNEPFALQALAEAVAALAPRMEPREAARQTSAAARHVVEAMKTTNSITLFPLAAAVAALAPRMEPGDASAAARQALKTMAKETGPFNVDRLPQAVAALAPRMEPGDASVAARQALKAMAKTTDADALGALARAVAALVPRMEPGEAARQTSAAARQAMDAMGKTTSSTTLLTLAAAVEALAPRIEPHDASAAARQAVEAMAKTTDADALSALARAVAALAPQMDPGEAARQTSAAARQAVEAMGKTNEPSALQALVWAVAALAPRMEAGDASAAARQAVEAMAKTTDADALGALARAVAALAPRMEPGEAARQTSAAARQVVAAMAEPQVWLYLNDRARAVAALAPRMEAGEASAAARQTVEAIGKVTQGYEIDALLAAVAALIVKVESEETSQRINSLALAVGNSGAPPALFAELVPLAEASRPMPGRFSEQYLVDLLKMPTCQQPARQVIVRQLGWQCGQPFANQWEFVEWAHQHRPDLDLTSPPTRP